MPLRRPRVSQYASRASTAAEAIRRLDPLLMERCQYGETFFGHRREDGKALRGHVLEGLDALGVDALEHGPALGREHLAHRRLGIAN